MNSLRKQDSVKGSPFYPPVIEYGGVVSDASKREKEEELKKLKEMWPLTNLYIVRNWKKGATELKIANSKDHSPS